MFGAEALLTTCAELLGAEPGIEPLLHGLPVPLTFLGGRHARALVLEGRLAAREQDYWPRVWALRALRYAWDDDLAGPVVRAIDDPAWRVREVAAAVAGRREVGAAADRCAAAASDPVPRVRVAAVRALAVIGEAEHVPALQAARHDPEIAVVRAADRTLDTLSTRLDREL